MKTPSVIVDSVAVVIFSEKAEPGRIGGGKSKKLNTSVCLLALCLYDFGNLHVGEKSVEYPQYLDPEERGNTRKLRDILGLSIIYVNY